MEYTLTMHPMIDLHSHTSMSDGDLSPDELIAYARLCGIKIFSITDHDTLSAYTPTVMSSAEKFDIRLIMGVELSTIDEHERRYHILGYGKNLLNTPLHNRILSIQKDREQTADQMCTCMIRHGWYIDRNRFASIATITKTHIGQAFIEHPENRERLLKEHNGQLPTIGQFIEEWLIPGKPCFVPFQHPLRPEEAITLIHESGGISVLAHPSEYILKGDTYEELIPRMKKYGIKGLEAFSIVFDRSHNDFVLDDSALLLSIAKKENLYVTGGSDFHTSDTNRFGRIIDLGFRNYSWSVPEKEIEALLLAI